MKLLLAYSVRNVWVRSSTTALTIAGLALVSLILLAVLMLGDGLNRALIESGSPDNVLLLRKGATTEIASGIYRDQAHVVRTLAEIAETSAHEPLAIPELVVLISLAKNGADTSANVVVRGTHPAAFMLRPQVRLTAGRAWQQGTTEIVVGAQIAKRFLLGGIGSHLRIGKREWLVVGIAEAQGTAFESEIWGDVDQLMAAYGRDSYSSLTLRSACPFCLSAHRRRHRIGHTPPTPSETRTRLLSRKICHDGHLHSPPRLHLHPHLRSSEPFWEAR